MTIELARWLGNLPAFWLAAAVAVGIERRRCALVGAAGRGF